MNDDADSCPEEFCTILTLDDACLAAILGGLSAQQLRTAAAVCKRLSAISQANSLWIRHIRDEIGLCIAAVKGVQQVPGAALKLYSRLRQAKQQLYALPAQALCTDGGCDEPFDEYWAGNMFNSKRSLYCSEANTQNISVFARLCPPAGNSSAGSSSHQAQQQQQQPGAVQLQEQGSMQGQQQQGDAQQQQQQRQAEQRREFLLDRCAQAARHLINEQVVKSHALRLRAQEQQQRLLQGVTARMSHLMGLVAKRFDGMDKKAAVEHALQTCSTQGLADFFIMAYMGQQQHASWAQSLFANLGDNEIQHVHEVAFALWSQMLDITAGHTFLLLPVPQPPTLLPNITAQAASRAARSAAAAGPSSSRAAASTPQAPTSAAGWVSAQQQQQQQRQRRLLCAEEQLQALCSLSTFGADTCIIQECILARDSVNGSTCPIRSGFVFLGHYQASAAGSTSQARSSSGSSAAALPRPAAVYEDAARAAAAGEATCTDVKAAAADLASLAYQPWVAAAHDLTSAAAVHVASGAGLLPPVIDYVRTGAAEYIEFAAPSQAQLAQQRQEWAALCGRGCAASSSSSGGVPGAGGAWPAGGWVAPVLWFRFTDAPRDNDDDLDDLEVFVGVQVPGEDEEVDEQQQDEAEHDSSDSSTSGEEQEALEEGDMMAADAGDQITDASQQGAAAGGGAMAEEQQQILLQGQQAVSSGLDGSVGAGTAGAAAAAAPTPRNVTSSSSTCSLAPGLPVHATEVAAALGWLPTGDHAGMLAVQLQQPRSANIVCALLLDCEDVKPEFNRSRGGCNIDMQLLMLRGHAVGQLPHELQVAAPGQWC